MTPLSTGPAWLVLALGCVLGAYGLAFRAVRLARRLPAGIAAALALSLLVAFEVAAMNALSLVHAVTRPGVLAAHAVAIAGAALALRSGPAGRRVLPRRPPALAALLVVPLLALALASALRYAPNNGDSMAYHLARVAHWIQDGDVSVYPSGSIRQNAMMPGAEYVLLALQVVSGSDRLAALLQTFAFVVVVATAPALARLAGAPRRVALLAAPAVAALPTALLQASSTQNDLVAAAICAGAVSAAAWPIRRRAPHAVVDVLLLAVACSAAVLVKPSAALVAGPFLALGAVRELRRRGLGPLHGALPTLAVAGIVMALLVVPELARRQADGQIELVAGRFAYPLVGQWMDRGENVLRGVAHHLPVPGVAAPAERGARHGAPLVPGWEPTLPHEDRAGNPVHAAAIVIAGVAALARWRRIPRRGRWAIAAFAVAWIAFHTTLRDNAYLARLQLPLFALAPVFLATVPVAAGKARRLATAAAAAITGVALAYAGVVAVMNSLRPPLAPHPEPVEADYYRNATINRDAQLTVLDVAAATRCDRIGLFMGESGFEYPLVWQAMQRGIEVRHVFGSDPWPCLVYFEPFSFQGWDLPRAPVALDRDTWAAAASNAGGVYLFRRLAREGGVAGSGRTIPESSEEGQRTRRSSTKGSDGALSGT